jgi:RNA-directed DNA polymerase
MDDLLRFGDKAELRQRLVDVERFIGERLHLRLKDSATRLAPVTEGVPFLGFRIFPGLVRIDRHSLRRFRRRLREREQRYLAGELDVAQLAASAQSMVAHLRHADTLRLRQSLLPRSLALG